MEIKSVKFSIKINFGTSIYIVHYNFDLVATESHSLCMLDHSPA